MHRASAVVRGSRHLLKLHVDQTNIARQNGLGAALGRKKSSAIDTLFPNHHVFADRHIGPNLDEMQSMLEYIGCSVSFYCHSFSL